MIQRQRFVDALTPHHLEAHRVGEAEVMIAIRPKPAICRSRFQITSRGDHRIHRISVDRIQQPAPGVGSLFTNYDNVHLRNDEIRCDEASSARDKIVVHCRNIVMTIDTLARGRQPP